MRQELMLLGSPMGFSLSGTSRKHSHCLIAETWVSMVTTRRNMDVNSIRHYSKAYFHGHSVGGTNPSLLEAMASECFVLAHDNIFNRAVLKENSLYYPNAEKVTEMLNDIENICAQHKKAFTDGNVEEIKNEYSWEHLVDQHEECFKWLLEQKKASK